MHFPTQVNYLAVLVTGIVIFALGGLWYSKVLFANRWLALQGVPPEHLKPEGSVAGQFIAVFICGLLTAFVLEVILNHFPDRTVARGAAVGLLCWLGFAGATSFATVLFSKKPLGLWMIDSGYNLVSFVIGGIILAAWK